MFDLLCDELQFSEATGHLIEYSNDITPIIPGRSDELKKTEAALMELKTLVESNNKTFNESTSVIICVYFHSSPHVLHILSIVQCSHLKV